jgi:hypothetical protein
MKRIILAVAISATLFGAIGNSSVSARKDPACTVNPFPGAVGQPYTVSVSGLPTNSPVYLWVTYPDASVHTTLLGSTSTGSFTVSYTPGYTGVWNYQFTGPTKSNGTTVFAGCSQSVR